MQGAKNARAFAINKTHFVTKIAVTVPKHLFLFRREPYPTQRISRFFRRHLNLAVFYLDIDHFKQVNDKYGHEVGDQMIVAVTRRIANLLRSCDSFARLGGDEFAILQAEVSEPRDCASLAARVVKAMSEPFPLNGTQILSSVSIGIAIYPNNAYDREDLLRVSDLALYRAKHQGRNRFAFFEPKMEFEEFMVLFGVWYGGEEPACGFVGIRCDES